MYYKFAKYGGIEIDRVVLVHAERVFCVVLAFLEIRARVAAV